MALEFFDPLPICNTNITIPKQEYIIKTAEWGLRKNANTSQGNGIRAIMGEVPYAVGNIDSSRLNASTMKLTSLALDIFFPIGDLSFTASRESLELDEKTVKNITSSLGKIYGEFIQKTKDQINDCGNAWDARILLFNLTSSPGIGSLVNSSWNDGAFLGAYKNFDLTDKYPTIDTKTLSHTLLTKYCRAWRWRSKSARKETISGSKVTLDVNNRVYFVVDDLRLKSHCRIYINQFVQVEEKGIVYLFSAPKGGDINTTLNEALATIKELGNPKVMMASELAAMYPNLIVPTVRAPRRKKT